MSIFIPVLEIKLGDNRYWEVSDSYNTGDVLHLQIQVHHSSFLNAGLFWGAEQVSDAVISVYYR